MAMNEGDRAGQLREVPSLKPYASGQTETIRVASRDVVGHSMVMTSTPIGDKGEVRILPPYMDGVKELSIARLPKAERTLPLRERRAMKNKVLER